MKKGVLSPWEKKPEPTAIEKVIANSDEVPKREIRFKGRAFHIYVRFYTADTDAEALTSYAKDALGTAISEILKIGTSTLEALQRQSIELDARKALWPKVTVNLGPVTLYVKASSYEPAMAELMAIDRIALALSNAKAENQKIRQHLDDRDIFITRSA